MNSVSQEMTETVTIQFSSNQKEENRYALNPHNPRNFKIKDKTLVFYYFAETVKKFTFH